MSEGETDSCTSNVSSHVLCSTMNIITCNNVTFVYKNVYVPSSDGSCK